MTTSSPTWTQRTAGGLRALAARPWTLFFTLLAVNALAMPYAGLVHDARLYSLQALNRVSAGAYADDLFLRYGSQDQYSLFPPLSAFAVGWLGVQPAFFLLYLAGNALLLWGMMRLVQRLIEDRAIS